MNVDLRTCASAEAAVLLAPDVRQIVHDIISPIACERDSERTGGWFAFWRGDESGEIVTPVVGFPAGLVSPERFQKYIHFANEKAVRLARNPEHVSSYWSRDDRDIDHMRHKYGGAIRCGINDRTRLIFSFSGFSEIEDEAICVILAVRLCELTDNEVTTICSVSGNDLLARYSMERQGNQRLW